MQTVTGTARFVGGDAKASLTKLQVQERLGGKFAGNVLFDVTTDINGVFSFQLMPGQFYLRFGNDLLPFRVRLSSGSATIDQLVESV